MSRARIRVGPSAWMVPAAAAAAATAYLAWGGYVSAPDSRWLYLTRAWWRVWLRPGSAQTPLIVLALWLVALACYWWPRRLQAQLAGLVTVVAMVAIGGVLTASSLARCRAGASWSAVAGWVLDLYVGNPPQYPSGACQGAAPLALQLGGVVSLGATMTGALAAAAVLWRQPLDRLRARLVRDAVILTGLDAMTLPLLRRLAATGRPAGIVVIEPDAGHPLLEEARATGARVVIGHPTSPRVLLPVIAGGRGCALRRLYALGQDTAENEAVLAAARSVLGRHPPDPQRQPHLVVRIDDPRHAEHWRGWHVGNSGLWFEDALSPHESTACALAAQALAAGARQLVLCGDSTLALAILRELARRAWERRELAKAADHGHARLPGAACRDHPGGKGPDAFPLERLVLLDGRAGDLHREYLATSSPAVAAALPGIYSVTRRWEDHLLAMLDGLPPGEADDCVVIVADALTERARHEAGRAARLHPGTSVLVVGSGGAGGSSAIFDRLQPVQRSLLVDGEVPEDLWTRVARHWHECFRLRRPPLPGEPRTLTSRPWAELGEFIRQDNILQLRSVMTAVVACGRRWVPTRAVPPGSFIELSQRELEQVAIAEHTRWYERRRAAGWAPRAGPGSVHVNHRVVPWAELPAGDREAAVSHLREQLQQLEDVGFMPVLPAGGPPGAAEYERLGTVRARRLSARRPWTRASGEELAGAPGDWRVTDDDGDERTIRDPEFRASHEPLTGERWRRTGSCRAWQVQESQVLRTMEGRAVARPGDWVVEGRGGERWPVTDAQFRRTYRISPGAA